MILVSILTRSDLIDPKQPLETIEVGSLKSETRDKLEGVDFAIICCPALEKSKILFITDEMKAGYIEDDYKGDYSTNSIINGYFPIPDKYLIAHEKEEEPKAIATTDP